MARPDYRLHIPAELVVAALVTAGALPLTRLFRSGGIVPALFGAVLFSSVIAWALRRARLVVIASALLSAAAFIWYAALAYFHNALWGPFPSPRSIRLIGEAIAAGVRTSTTEVAPVIATTSLMVLVSMIVWGITWLADDAVHKLRHPLLAIGFVMPMFIFPGTLLSSPHRVVDVALFIAAALAVLFTDEKARLGRWGRAAGYGSPGWRPGLAARIGVLVVVVAVALAPIVPGYATPPGGEGPGGSGGGGDKIALNPLVSIRPRLTARPESTLFFARSTVPTYWRITALDQFDGHYWTAPARAARTLISDRTIPTQLGAGFTRTVTQQIDIRRLGGPWLPATYNPVRVEGRAGVRVEPVTRSLVLADVLRPGQKVTVTSVLTEPPAAQLDAVGRAEFLIPELASFLRLPETLPEEVVRLTHAIADRERTPFRKAVAIQDYLRGFLYDEDVAEGHSFDDLVTFLTRVKAGYCEQFSAAMAVMARVINLPSRVAIGFAVGETAGKNRYKVTTRQAHAWVEIFFPGYGWLAFEPTPRQEGTIVPSYARPEGVAPGADPSTAASASPTPSAEPTSSNDPRRAPDPESSGTITGAGGTPAWVIAVAVTGGVLAVLLVLLPGTAAWLRWRRRRRAGDPRALATAYYLDFLEWCAAARVGRRRAETPGEYAGRLAERFSSSSGPIRDLGTAAAAVLWSPDPGDAPEQARLLGTQARRAVAQGLPFHKRLLPSTGWGWWKTL